MKNLVSFDPSEQSEYILNILFETELVSNIPLVRKMVQSLEKRRLIFFDYTDQTLEWSHFTTWMGAIGHRKYENPVINDLYYIHELLHAEVETYSGDISFSSWFSRMVQNEVLASVFSESYIYFLEPELRALSFDFDILVDKYDMSMSPDKLAHEEFSWNLYNCKLFTKLSEDRIRVMSYPDPMCFIEGQIHSYVEQNRQWATVWKDSWREVETFMASNPSINEHMDWLQTVSSDGVPFRYEAEQFQSVLDANKVRSGNAILQS